MIKIFLIFFIFFLINNCSFDKKSGIWTEDVNSEAKNRKIEILFEKKEIINDEFNSDFIIQTPLKNYKNLVFEDNNDYGFYNLKLNFVKLSKYKFSKIQNFNNFEPIIGFHKNELIFFDKNGSIIKFDNHSKPLWKKNYYSKREKKNSPILNFSIGNEKLIVSDNLSKYYALDLYSGEKVWSKIHNTTFNSEIKIDKDKFYIIDSFNIMYCFSLIDGSKLWEFNSDYELIKSQKKLSIVFDKNKVIFNNSKGDIYALNKNNGNLLWLVTTKDTNENFQTFLLKNSKIVLNNDSLFLSNNMNNFFSIDANSGFINWKQNINSDIKPIVIDNLILSISLDGYLFIIDKISGNILRITDLFSNFSDRKRKKISPVGFIVGKDEIYLSLDNGKILIIDLATGKSISTFKLGGEKISRPFVNKDFLYFVKNNEIVKLK